jgi:hypothetical protein
MAPSRKRWLLVGVALIVAVISAAVVAIEISRASGNSSPNTPPPTSTATILPLGFSRNITGIFAQLSSFYLASGASYSGQYTVRGPGYLAAYVLTPSQVSEYETTGNVSSFLWSSGGGTQVAIHYSIPAPGEYYFLLFHPSGRWSLFQVTSAIQVTQVVQ